MKIYRSDILRELLEESMMSKLGFTYLLETIEVTMANVGLFYEREGAIFHMILEGATLEEVGREFDLTKERVRQIFFKSLRRAKNALEVYAVERRSVERYKERIRTLEAENRLLRKSLPLKVEGITKVTLIKDLDFSVRLVNCCKSADIHTLEELVKMKPNDLLKFRNFGRKSLNELREYFKEHNIDWG